MRFKRIVKSIFIMLIATAVLIYYSQNAIYLNAQISITKSTVENNKNENYIVRTKSKDKLVQIREKYSESSEVNNNNEGLLEENKIVSVQLSSSQINKLENDNSIKYLEKDEIIEGSNKTTFVKSNWFIKNKKKHKKQVKRNKSSDEWNIQMINASDVKTEEKKRNEKIRIAILDSGIDWGNDINLVYQVSLVPGEDEMTQVFMDGSGHGSSVASLIAAKDNGEGITGINPNAEIYSIRVLDDENEAPLSRVIEGIYMAIEQKVNIINMSFGLNRYSKALEEAIQAATNSGILVVAAAGNTGDDGVQYPAAYDEVLAVGAVDKNGEVTEYSAKGEEVELVAPGELVRTTGFLGTEVINAGTSLAAPQVSAVASLIWEKDLSVSADFVRTLLNESANLYGDTDAYGNGLVDAEYALDHYEEFKVRYKETEKNKPIIKENKKKIITFKETGCAEGCWYGNEHEAMIEENYFNVREGARFPDTDEYILNPDDKDTYVFKRMSINPWWHGYYKLNDYYLSNYVSAIIYATRMADAIKKYGYGNQGKASVPANYFYASDMRNDINYMDKNDIWNIELKKIKNKKSNQSNTKVQNQKDSVGFRRAFLWGMAIHSATDIYAHSVRYQGKRITHSTKVNGVYRADSTEVCTARYEDAQKIARQMMNQYKNGESLSTEDLLPTIAPTQYQIYNLHYYVKQTAGAALAANVVCYSYDTIK